MMTLQSLLRIHQRLVMTLQPLVRIVQLQSMTLRLLSIIYLAGNGISGAAVVCVEFAHVDAPSRQLSLLC